MKLTLLLPVCVLSVGAVAAPSEWKCGNTENWVKISLDEATRALTVENATLLDEGTSVRRTSKESKRTTYWMPSSRSGQRYHFELDDKDKDRASFQYCWACGKFECTRAN